MTQTKVKQKWIILKIAKMFSRRCKSTSSNLKNSLRTEMILFYLKVLTNSLIHQKTLNNLRLNLKSRLKFKIIKWTRICSCTSTTSTTWWSRKETKRWSNQRALQQLKFHQEIRLATMKWKSQINQMVQMLKDNIVRSLDVLSCKEAKNNTKSSKEQER